MSARTPRQHLSDTVVAQLHRAIASFMNDPARARELANVLRGLQRGEGKSGSAPADVMDTFHTIWRSTPRPSTMTDDQWDADFAHIEKLATPPSGGRLSLPPEPPISWEGLATNPSAGRGRPA